METKQNELETIYIHETHTLMQDMGELHIVNDTHHLIFNCDTLFNDLPTIVKMVTEARQEQSKMIIDSLIDEVKKLK